MDIRTIQETMENYVNTGEMVGGVLYVHRDGKTIYQNKWGTADKEGTEPISYDKSIFRMASMSKIVTSVGILKLCEEGRINLDDEVKKYLPFFSNMRVVMDERFEGIDVEEACNKIVNLDEILSLQNVKTVASDRDLTIRDLLTHSSGLEMGTYGILSRIEKTSLDDTLKERAEKLAEIALDFQPGTKNGYSPTGNYDVLARIIEVITDKEFFEYINEGIFKPLDMYNSVYQLSEEEERRLVPLYKWNQGEQLDVTGGMEDVKGVGNIGKNMQSGSAGIYCTAQDYDHFTQMLANRGYYNGKQVLKPETVKMLHTETAYNHFELENFPGTEWALGVLVRKNPKLTNSFVTEESYGWSGAFGTHMVVSPKDGLSFTFVMNRADIGGASSYISKTVEELVFRIFKDSKVIINDRN